jgi:hypothetical protein
VIRAFGAHGQSLTSALALIAGAFLARYRSGMPSLPRPSDDARQHAPQRRALIVVRLRGLRPRGGAERGRLRRTVPSLGPRMVCRTCCGIIGADVRPNRSERPQRESLTGRRWH